MKNFYSWKDIKDWAEKKGFKNLSARLQLNNDCWMSSGEFGRNQVEICDTLRLAETEEERLSIAKKFDNQFKTNYGLY